MSNGIASEQQGQGLQQLYYDPQTGQYMTATQNGQGLNGVTNYKYEPFKQGLPNSNSRPPVVNFKPTPQLVNQLAGAQSMFNSPLAIPQTRTAPKPSIGGKK